MKIYIITDMEGIAGIFLPEQLQRGTAEYAEARRLLTGEVNAAIDGAFAGGATEVVVKDGHGTGFNLILEEIDPRVEVIAGASIPVRLAGLDESFGGVFLVGYHAKAGTEGAICDHTMSSVGWTRYELCGREVGEMGIDAAQTGLLGVPVLLVTGDDKTCAEAEDLFGPELVTCCVKQGLARHSVRTKAPAAAREMVRAAAQEAVSRPTHPEPVTFDPPYEVRLTYVLTAHADGRPFDGVNTVRLDGRTVLYRGDDLGEVIARSLR